MHSGNIISLNSNNAIIIWEKKEIGYTLIKTFEEKCHNNNKHFHFIYYSKKENLIVLFLCGKVFFYAMNRKLKQNLNEIYITNNSFYENEKGKLFIGGYSDIYNSQTTQKYVINIKNQIIETIIKWSLFEVIVGRKFKCAWSFINVKLMKTL